MSKAELSQGFGNKLENIALSGIAGITGRDPRASFNTLFSEAYNTPDQYRSPRAYSNPPLEVLEAELLNLASSNFDSDKPNELNSLPWTEDRFSQGLHLATMLAFTDQHRQPVPIEHFIPEKASTFVDEVTKSADEKGRQITISEQFDLALKIADGSVLGASVVAHAGSRSIARNRDTKIDPRFAYSIDDVKYWRDCVSNFETLTGFYGDPAADTYHFWGTFIAGLLSETGERTRDRVLNPTYRKIYLNFAEATNLLRYRIGGKQGETHKEADISGYHIGSMIGALVKSD